MSFANMDLRVAHPSCILIAGPSNSGKTEWVKRFLLNASHMINPTPVKIYWCYSSYQPIYTELAQTLSNISFIEGLPENIEELFDKSKPQLLVIDDLMSAVGNDKRLADLFTKHSHHQNLSVIYIVQNLFNRGPQARTISLNAGYIVLFKNIRDKSQIWHLARQMYPVNPRFLVEAYNDATSKPFQYLFLDLKSNSAETARVRTGILPGEEHFCYVPSKKI